MGKPYGTWPLICTGLYLISRSGAELLLKQLEDKVPGTVADDTSCTSSGVWMCVLCSLACAAGRVAASSWNLVRATWRCWLRIRKVRAPWMSAYCVGSEDAFGECKEYSGRHH